MPLSRHRLRRTLLGGTFALAGVLGASAVAAVAADPSAVGVQLPAGTTRYVAGGDSYSSGNGLGDMIGEDCRRSTVAYPLLLEFGGDVDIDFTACSGARLDEGGSVGPLGPDVGLVTLTIGGNDAGYDDVLVHCAFTTTCSQRAFTSGSGETFDSLEQWADDFFVDYERDLADLLAGIGAAAPNARVVMVGYPPLFPSVGGIDDRLVCRIALNNGPVGFSEDERAAIVDMGARLNDAAARAAVAAGAEFVDPTPAFAAHAPCAEDGEWVEFVDLDVWKLKIDPASFHPNEAGQRALARLLSEHLAQSEGPR